MATRSLVLLLAFSLTSALNIGPCDFEEGFDVCGFSGNEEFKQENGRPSWDYSAMTGGFSGDGYLLLKEYDKECRLETSPFIATGEEKVSFAYYLNGDGERKSHVKLLQRWDEGKELILFSAEHHDGYWHHINVSLSVAPGQSFEVIWSARAHFDYFQMRHTYVGLDYLQITNEEEPVDKGCFRPTQVLNAQPWDCSGQGFRSIDPEERERFPEGTVCSSSCLDSFVMHGSPEITCINGEWKEAGEIIFMCIDETGPQIACPQRLELETPYGWGSMWHTVSPPPISDNIGVADVQLYIEGELQSDTTVTLELGKGLIHVMFLATDLSQNENTCTYYISVTTADQTPPQIEECPWPRTFVSSEPLAVHWDEPTITDDSGYIAEMTKNYSPDTLMAWGEHDVIYTASDNSSNVAICNFTVTISGEECAPLEPPSYGALVCHDSYSGKFCVTMCGEDGDFQVSSPDLHIPTDYVCTSAGQWFPYSVTFGCEADYSETPVMPQEYYFSGLCNAPNTQLAMRSQALYIFNTAGIDSVLGTNLTTEDFYTSCGPRQ